MRRALLLLLLASSALAQTEQVAGTSRNPQSAPMAMLMTSSGPWTLMLHGQLFVNHVNESGPRGDNKTFSTNWVMGSASRPFAGGTLLLRSMLSLEPATISSRRYPELFQTGETAFGKQLIDGQHPHDFFMELAAEYLRPAGTSTLYIYAAPIGDPALGPVAFPHRDSAMEISQAPLGHHFEDSTHIAYNVLTAGITTHNVTLEASAFHGGEPDEHRWDLGGGRIDSWAARVRWQPLRSVDIQVSEGRLTKPELVEPGYAKRITASVSTHVAPLSFAELSASVIWGQVYKEVHDRTLQAWLGETSLKLFGRHYLIARAESVDKDELFPHPIVPVVPPPPPPHPGLPSRGPHPRIHDRRAARRLDDDRPRRKRDDVSLPSDPQRFLRIARPQRDRVRAHAPGVGHASHDVAAVEDRQSCLSHLSPVGF